MLGGCGSCKKNDEEANRSEVEVEKEEERCTMERACRCLFVCLLLMYERESEHEIDSVFIIRENVMKVQTRRR